jgi:manganese-dependent ADP-ribose/CDP-alcohol diphosphatase
MDSPGLRIGIISDVQYVDEEDGTNHSKTRVRRYRQSLNILKAAASSFIKESTAFNVILGDIVDGKAAQSKTQEFCLDAVISSCQHSRWHFLPGNHDFYCFSREEIHQKYLFGDAHNSTSPEQLFYSVSNGLFRFVYLDTYGTNFSTQSCHNLIRFCHNLTQDVSVIGASSPKHHQGAVELLMHNNKNMSIEAINKGIWHEDDPLDHSRCHFVPYNGGLGEAQLTWLEAELMDAQRQEQRTIVFSHAPISKHCAHASNVSFNHVEVLCLLQRYHTVVAFIAGHDHIGGYHCDCSGIHHITPIAPVECAPGELSYGVLELSTAHMSFEWTGSRPSWPTSLPYRQRPPETSVLRSRDLRTEVANLEFRDALQEKYGVWPCAVWPPETESDAGWEEDCWTSARVREAEEKLEAQSSSSSMREHLKAKYTGMPDTFWHEFYKRNKDHFYKDRHYLHIVFPELTRGRGPGGEMLTLAELGSGSRVT